MPVWEKLPTEIADAIDKIAELPKPQRASIEGDALRALRKAEACDCEGTLGALLDLQRSILLAFEKAGRHNPRTVFDRLEADVLAEVLTLWHSRCSERR